MFLMGIGKAPTKAASPDIPANGDGANEEKESCSDGMTFIAEDTAMEMVDEEAAPMIADPTPKEATAQGKLWFECLFVSGAQIHLLNSNQQYAKYCFIMIRGNAKYHFADDCGAQTYKTSSHE